MEKKDISFGRWFGSLVLFSVVVALGYFWVQNNNEEKKKIETPIIATTTPSVVVKKELPDAVAPSKIKTATFVKNAFPTGNKAPANLVVASATYPTNTPSAKKAEAYIKEFIEGFMKDYADRKDIVTSYGVSADGSVTFSHGKKLLSYLYAEERDDGGAHPNVFFSSETFDMNEKKYELADLFIPNSGYLNAISAAATIFFVKDPNTNFDPKDSLWGSGLDPKIENFKTFTVSGDVIVFQLQDYQIGPHSEGPQKFEISVNSPEIKSIIRPELF